jgi:hypothetical protein
MATSCGSVPSHGLISRLTNGRTESPARCLTQRLQLAGATSEEEIHWCGSGRLRRGGAPLSLRWGEVAGTGGGVAGT